MGIALAAAAARRGAEVTLIAANVSLPSRPGSAASTSRPPPSSPTDDRDEFATHHVLLMAAAPADFRAAEPAAGKLKRQDGLELQPGADRGHPRRARRRSGEGQTIVGFAAEHGATRSAAPAASSSARAPT